MGTLKSSRLAVSVCICTFMDRAEGEIEENAKKKFKTNVFPIWAKHASVIKCLNYRAVLH